MKKEVENNEMEKELKKEMPVKSKKNKVWVFVLIGLLILSIYLFSAVKSLYSKNNPIQGNVVKDQEIFKNIEERIGFQGVRDPVDKSRSSFVIKGTAFGGMREITFDKWNADILIENGKIVGFEGDIEGSSINTKIKWLNEKLIGEEILNVKKYPQIKFKYLSLESNGGINEVLGDSTMLGRIQEIRIPVTITDESISGDFVLNLRPFKISSNSVAKEARVIFKLYK